MDIIIKPTRAIPKIDFYQRVSWFSIGDLMLSNGYTLSTMINLPAQFNFLKDSVSCSCRCIINLFKTTKPLLIQSEEMQTTPEVGEGVTSKQGIVTFNDVGVADSLDIGSHLSSFFNSESDEDAKLGNYLSRPVRVASYTWTEGVTFSTAFEPWSLFFNNSIIKKKLDNFSRLRCKLKVKFVINSSPFYYGAIRACYLPMYFPQSVSNPGDEIPLSQTPGVFLEPSKMSSVEMDLPFLWTGAWLDVTKATEYSDMGKIQLVQYYPLSSANGVAGAGITISVYVWAEDVELMGPTTRLAVQNDEYSVSNGTISGPATAVANYSRYFFDIPFIGNLARAANIGASAVSGIAKLFGYSNPPMIDDVHAFQPKSFHAFANVETRMPLDKLSLDPKNEVTIDNTVCDIDPTDPLSFKNTIMRESYIGQALWTGVKTVNQPLATGLVSPAHVVTYVETNQSRLYHTPSSYFGRMFQQWRGSMQYRFKFIKTKYHKGRVIIAWDPQENLISASNLETSIFTRVVDLEFEDEVTIDIPYKATNPYLEVANTDEFSSSLTPSFPSFSTRNHNGMFTMRVLNVLTGPTTAPDVGILVFAKPLDDLRYSRPRSITNNLTTLAVQSQELSITNQLPTTDTVIDLITVGETIISLRPLLHRASFSNLQPMGQYLTGVGTYVGVGNQLTTNILPRVPKPYGFDGVGNNWGVSIVTPGTNKRFNYVSVHPLRWTLECFVGYRGSTNIHINPIVNGTDVGYIDSLSVSRYYATESLNGSNQNVNRFTTTTGFGTDSALARTAITSTNNVARKNTGQSGMSLTNTNVQSALSVNVPQYIRTRFNTAPYIMSDVTSAAGNSIYDNVQVNSTFQLSIAGSSTRPWPIMEVYYSAGTDFNPVFFVCVPTVYSYSTPTSVDSYAP